MEKQEKKNGNTLYQGCENKHLIRRLAYLVEYVAKHGDAQSEHDEIEHIKDLLEQRDIVTYLQGREKELSEQVHNGAIDSPAYEETRVRHMELLSILKDLKIEAISGK